MNNWLKIPMEHEISNDFNGLFIREQKQTLMARESKVKQQMASGGTAEQFRQLELEKQALTAAQEVIDSVWNKLHQ
ncbi:EscE/YscE/SsaE family type III secretion system needle protein co-chaperone [Thalassomonas viridans]|uniref:EscE/YscE/SsaE family type III secretion system needle protein co-chaperone n=1 Tax=Thalassomonas viridans TaxID=137584 RepID=A0AAE9YXF8_9GAMM|nr:EscE/YscE/SsaE family type III secretion system needle protein co-chaperone [Thalassomonas viridans]WDE02800.1 EscE/YscE/SsaE family type III secretion system needle protein co-chaperone [Thalassomonas viridans]